MKITLRDLFWLLLLVAVTSAWFADRRWQDARHNEEIDQVSDQSSKMYDLFRMVQADLLEERAKQTGAQQKKDNAGETAD